MLRQRFCTLSYSVNNYKLPSDQFASIYVLVNFQTLVLITCYYSRIPVNPRSSLVVFAINASGFGRYF